MFGNATKDISKDNQADYNCCITGCRSDTNCSNAALKPCIQREPMSSIVVRIDIDLNTKLSGFDGCLPISIEKEKKVGVEPSKRIDLEIGLEDNFSHQVKSVPSPKIYPGFAQEVHTTKRGCESNGVAYVQFANNLSYTDKNSAEIRNGGTPADNQCQKELVATAVEADNKCDHTNGPSIESFACNQEELRKSGTILCNSSHLQLLVMRAPYVFPSDCKHSHASITNCPTPRI